MIKDILVNLSLGERGGFAGEYAVSIAAAFEAHVAGIAFLYDPVIPLSGAGYIPADVIDTQEHDNALATKAAADHFTRAATRAGVSAEPLTLSSSVSGGRRAVQSAWRGVSISRWSVRRSLTATPSRK
jgi:hypothetical protein